jgi:uncharacterized protein YceH (UPF0502 family)
MTPPPLPQLSLLETRVLGVLVEKQLATPDIYPLTLNAIVAGCNQKTSRDPVINAAEAEVQMALDSLRRQTLVIESSGGRVMRYAHNVNKVLALPSATVAIVAVLMLRGPQTPGELRANCERLHRFADISALEAYLDEMATRAAGALVVKLPKQPGSREHRYAHLLSGAPAADAATFQPETDDGITTGELAALKANVAQLREEMHDLRRLVERLYDQLGVAKTPGT